MTTPGGADAHDPFAAPKGPSLPEQPPVPPWEAEAFPPPPAASSPTGNMPPPPGLVTPPPAPGRQFAQQPTPDYGPPPQGYPATPHQYQTPSRPYIDSPSDMGWANIVGFVSSLLCFSVVGIIFSHIGVYQANRGRARHKGLGVAGLIIGYLGLVLGVWFWGAVLTSEDFWFCFENPEHPSCTY